MSSGTVITKAYWLVLVVTHVAYDLHSMISRVILAKMKDTSSYFEVYRPLFSSSLDMFSQLHLRSSIPCEITHSFDQRVLKSFCVFNSLFPLTILTKQIKTGLILLLDAILRIKN